MGIAVEWKAAAEGESQGNLVASGIAVRVEVLRRLVAAVAEVGRKAKLACHSDQTRQPSWAVTARERFVAVVQVRVEVQLAEAVAGSESLWVD